MILRQKAAVRMMGWFLLCLSGVGPGGSGLLATASGANLERNRALITEARQRPTIEGQCKIGEDLSFTLGAEKIARFDGRTLGIGLDELLIWQQEDTLQLCCVWADGRISYNPKKVALESLSWIPRPVILFELRWRAAEDTPGLAFRLRADTDKKRLQEATSQILQKSRQAAEKQVSATDRLAGFVQWWTEVKYNFAFFDHVPNVNWDQVLLEYLPRIQKAQSLETYYRELKACAALLQDAHTDIREPDSLGIRSRPALCIRPIEGKAIVTEVGPSGEIAQAAITRGTQIVRVDSKPIETVLKQDLYQYICASTPQWRDRQAYAQLLQGTIGTKVTIGIIDTSGQARDVVLTRGGSQEIPAYEPFVYRPLPNGIAYVAIHSFESDEVVKRFDAVFAEIDKAPALILDVRDNGGGNSAFGDAIIARLIDAPLAKSRWKTRQYVAAFQAWKRNQPWYEGDAGYVKPRGEKPFTKPIVVLIGPGTISAAEDFVVPLHAGKRVILVGEKTAGSTGQPLPLPLPGGGLARICTKRDSYPDGREFVGRGIAPDVEVHPTQQDIRTGRDTALEKAVEVIGDRNRSASTRVGNRPRQ